MEKTDLEFDSFIEDAKQESCFFCGGDPVFLSKVEMNNQSMFFTCCESCMTGILGKAAISRLELSEEGATIH